MSRSRNPSSPTDHASGILKNSQSYQATSPNNNAFTSPPLGPSDDLPSLDETVSNSRPGMPNREMSEKEIVQMNTELNAGPTHRRNSSNPRASVSRRQSTTSDTSIPDAQQDTTNPRLQWDEANLFLNEGQMGGKMKIDEPKTPFVHGEDNPMAEEDEEPANIDPNHIVVDELDKAKVLEGECTAVQQKRSNDIPDLDLGEPENHVMERRASDSERKVSVSGPTDPDAMDIEDTGRHGEGREEDMQPEELAKHRKFENMRKRHYEMGNVKNLLG